MIRYEFVVVALLLGTSVAWGGTMDSTFNNTVVSTDSKGAASDWFFNPDGTYTVSVAGKLAGAGHWKLNGDKICSTPDAIAGQPAPAETCVAYVDGKTVGDSWTTSDAKGGTFTVSIKAGR